MKWKEQKKDRGKRAKTVNKLVTKQREDIMGNLSIEIFGRVMWFMRKVDLENQMKYYLCVGFVHMISQIILLDFMCFLNF